MPTLSLSLELALERVEKNPSRSSLIAAALGNKECYATETGALATCTPANETGRIPNHTYIVRNPSSEESIDWNSGACNPLPPEIFDQLWNDAQSVLRSKDTIYQLDRAIGADASCSLPTTVLTDRALSALFIDNMFRPAQDGIEQSLLADLPFTLIALPSDKIQLEKYSDTLSSNMIVAMDMDRRLGLVYGLSYMGGMKKTLFTVMNYLLPNIDVLPLHCSANQGSDGSTAILLGLSGTGKTTLSNDPDRLLIGDDEHAWTDRGITNFENGCYAKLINLSAKKEPEIAKAVFTDRPIEQNGVIIENAMMYPNGTFDLSDSRLTENARVSYPLTFLQNTSQTGTGGHPSTILFLTADAHGVLPPIARLSEEEAQLWFLMGYTSKLAGTEVGIQEPKSAFSRFFGGPFMPRNPRDYTDLLKKKLDTFKVSVYLINTGWTGGPYGIGKRFDILDSKTMVAAALDGSLDSIEYKYDERFHFSIPLSCPGVDASILDPKSTWGDPEAYETAADLLADEFQNSFTKNFGACGFDQTVIDTCPSPLTA